MKKCNKCNIEKDISKFYKDKTRKTGLDYYCKECRKEVYYRYYNKNREYIISKMIQRNRKNNKKL